MNLNQPLFWRLLPTLLTTLCGVFITFYLIDWVKSQRHASRHLAYRNILAHGHEYALESALCACNYMLLPAVAHLLVLFSQEHPLVYGGEYVGVVLSVLVIAVWIGLMVCILGGHSREGEYSVLFCGLDAKGTLAFFTVLLTYFRPLLITLTALFIPQLPSRIIIIAIHSLHLLSTCLSFLHFRHTLTAILRITKVTLSLFVWIAASVVGSTSHPFMLYAAGVFLSLPFV